MRAAERCVPKLYRSAVRAAFLGNLAMPRVKACARCLSDCDWGRGGVHSMGLVACLGRISSEGRWGSRSTWSLLGNTMGSVGMSVFGGRLCSSSGSTMGSVGSCNFSGGVRSLLGNALTPVRAECGEASSSFLGNTASPLCSGFWTGSNLSPGGPRCALVPMGTQSLHASSGRTGSVLWGRRGLAGKLGNAFWAPASEGSRGMIASSGFDIIVSSGFASDARHTMDGCMGTVACLGAWSNVATKAGWRGPVEVTGVASLGNRDVDRSVCGGAFTSISDVDEGNMQKLLRGEAGQGRMCERAFYRTGAATVDNDVACRTQMLHDARGVEAAMGHVCASRSHAGKEDGLGGESTAGSRTPAHGQVLPWESEDRALRIGASSSGPWGRRHLLCVCAQNRGDPHQHSGLLRNGLGPQLGDFAKCYSTRCCFGTVGAGARTSPRLTQGFWARVEESPGSRRWARGTPGSPLQNLSPRWAAPWPLQTISMGGTGALFASAPQVWGPGTLGDHLQGPTPAVGKSPFFCNRNQPPKAGLGAVRPFSTAGRRPRTNFPVGFAPEKVWPRDATVPFRIVCHITWGAGGCGV
jgi:hypothetical protein